MFPIATLNMVICMKKQCSQNFDFTCVWKDKLQNLGYHKTCFLVIFQTNIQRIMLLSSDNTLADTSAGERVVEKFVSTASLESCTKYLMENETFASEGRS